MEVRSQFRLPVAIHDWLKDQARKEHRSVNGQMVAELEARKQEKTQCEQAKAA